MKLVRIFVSDISEDGLWSIHLDGQAQNEFDKFFDRMNDIEWLLDFFDRNKTDLNSGFFGKITIYDAVLKNLEEAGEMEEVLYDFAEKGFATGGGNLQHLFKPLSNFEYSIILHQKSKARLKNGWLRLYALRIAKNCYLVTGGSIKLTQDMKREHLRIELKKIR